MAKLVILSNQGNWDSDSLGAVGTAKVMTDLDEFVRQDQDIQFIDSTVYSTECAIAEKLNELEMNVYCEGQIIRLITAGDDDECVYAVVDF